MANATKAIFDGQYYMTLTAEEATTIAVLCATTSGHSSKSPVKHLGTIYSALNVAGLTYDLMTPERQALKTSAQFAEYPPDEKFEAGQAYQSALGGVYIRNSGNNGWINRFGSPMSDPTPKRPIKKMVAE